MLQRKFRWQLGHREQLLHRDAEDPRQADGDFVGRIIPAHFDVVHGLTRYVHTFGQSWHRQPKSRAGCPYMVLRRYHLLTL